MSENRNYAKQITNTVDYLKQACELYMCLDDDDCQKAWLLFFFDWAYNTTDMGLHIRDHYVVTSLSFGCNALDTDDSFVLERTVEFLLTILDTDIISNYLRGASAVINLVAVIVQKLVIIMADHCNSVYNDVVLVLRNVFLIRWRPHHRSTLVHIALSSGLMLQIVYRLHSDDAEVLEHPLLSANTALETSVLVCGKNYTRR